MGFLDKVKAATKVAGEGLSKAVEEAKKATDSMKAKDNYKNAIVNTYSEEGLNELIQQIEEAPLSDRDKESLRNSILRQFQYCKTKGTIRRDAILPFMNGTSQAEADKYIESLKNGCGMSFDELVKIAEKEATDTVFEKCDKGKCTFLEGHLIFSCPNNCVCQRKKDNLENIWLIRDEKILDAAFKLAITKKFVNIDYCNLAVQSNDYSKDKLREETEACNKQFYGDYYSFEPDEDGYVEELSDEEINEYIVEMKRDDAISNLIQKYFPRFSKNHNYYQLVYIAAFDVGKCPDFDENSKFKFLKELHDRLEFFPAIDLDNENVFTNIKYLLLSLDFTEAVIENYCPINDNSRYFILHDLSIFERNEADFAYSLFSLYESAKITINAIMNEDLSMPSVSIICLFDDTGHLKPAGIGGTKVGEVGDTIWNSLSLMIDGTPNFEEKERLSELLLRNIRSFKELPDTRGEMIKEAMAEARNNLGY